MEIKQLKRADGKFNQTLYDAIVKAGRKYLRELYVGLDDEDADIREGCVEALGDIGAIESLPILIEHASDSDWHVRWHVMQSLNMILGVPPKNIIDILTGCSALLKQRHKFKKRLKVVFNALFPDNSETKILKGYGLIRLGKIDEGASLVLKGISKKKINMNALHLKLANMLKEKGWDDEAQVLLGWQFRGHNI